MQATESNSIKFAVNDRKVATNYLIC